MADARIEVEVAAKLDNFGKDLQKAGGYLSNFAVNAEGQITTINKSIATMERQLKVFQSGLKNTVDPSRIVTLNNAIEITKKRIEETNQVISRTGFKKLTAGSNEAGLALMNLGRVAQDAPYGFIGIANNLNPLLESFQRLRAESGSNAAALKALSGSLIGVGGVGIALSLVTAAMQFSEVGMRMWGVKTKDAKTESEDFVKTLTTLQQVQLKGEQAAAEEIVNLDNLYRATQNTNLSYRERKKAVDELQAQYPSYFGNLKDENILAGKTAGAYIKLKDAIIAGARSRAASEMMVANQKETLANERKITELKAQQERAAKEAGAQAKAAGSYNPYGGSTAGVAAAMDTQRKLAIYQDNINKLQNVNNRLKQKDLELSKYVDTSVVKYGTDTLTGVGDKLEENNQKGKTFSDIFKALSIDLKQISVNNQFGIEESTTEKIKAYRTAINDLISIGVDPASVSISGLNDKITLLGQTLNDIEGRKVAIGLDESQAKFDASQIEKRVKAEQDGMAAVEATHRSANEAEAAIFSQMNKRREEAAHLGAQYVDQMQQFAQDFMSLNITAVSSIGSVFSSLGEAMASGDYSNFGQSILQAFASYLGELGSMFIKQGVANILMGKAMAINPLTAAAAPATIASGWGMIAAGATLSVGSGMVGAAGKGGGSGSQGGPGYEVSSVPAFAKGVTDFAGGLALVGERGPELVNLPRGSDVVPNHMTRDYLAGSRQKSTVVNIHGNMEMSMGKLRMALMEEDAIKGRKS